MPVYCNYEARVVEGPDDIRSMLEHQVCGSVRWTASMQKLVDQGHRLFIELGPGKTLAGMMGRICKDATVISIEDVPSLEAAVAELGKSNDRIVVFKPPEPLEVPAVFLFQVPFYFLQREGRCRRMGF